MRRTHKRLTPRRAELGGDWHTKAGDIAAATGDDEVALYHYRLALQFRDHANRGRRRQLARLRSRVAKVRAKALCQPGSDVSPVRISRRPTHAPAARRRRATALRRSGVDPPLAPAHERRRA